MSYRLWLRRSALWLGFAFYVAQPAQAADVDCGATITTDTVVTGGTITAGACSSGLTVDGVELDLNGWTLQADGGDSGDGVTLVGKGATLKNGTVRGFDASGVFLSGQGGHRLEDLYVVDNGGAGVKIDADGNRVENVVAENNNVGILVELNARQNRLTSCHSRLNSSQGFRIGGTKNSLAQSTAVANDVGIFVDTPDGGGSVTIAENLVDGNTAIGVIVTGSERIKLVGNVLSRNGDHGFYAAYNSALKIQSNRAAGNGNDGFRLQQSSSIDMKGNESIGNDGIGYYLADVSGLKAKGNAALFNGDSGASCGGAQFCLDALADSSMQQSVAIGGEGGGLRIDGSDLKLSKNAAFAVGTDGFRVRDGSTLVLQASRSIAAGSAGIRLEADDVVVDVSRSIVFASNGSFDLIDEGGCAMSSWSKSFFGGDEEPLSGVTTNDDCVD